MKNKLLLASMLTLLTVALIAVPAMARQGRGQGMGDGMGGGMGPGGMGMGLGFGPFWLDNNVVKELGLSEKQIDQLDALHNAKQQDQIDLNANMRKAQLVFNNLMRADNVSEAAAKKAADNVVVAQEKMMYAQIEFHLAVRNILTADQFAKLPDLRPNKMNKRRHHRSGQPDDYTPRRGR